MALTNPYTDAKQCNRGLGLLGDSPAILEAAIAYLKMEACYR